MREKKNEEEASGGGKCLIGRPAGTRTRKDSLGGYRDILFHHGTHQRRIGIVTKIHYSRQKINDFSTYIISGVRRALLGISRLETSNRTSKNYFKNIFKVNSLISLEVEIYLKNFSQKDLQSLWELCIVRVS